MSAGEKSLESELVAQRDRLSNCVHCGFCLPACPTYVRLHDEADSPRGRLHLMGAVVEGRLGPESMAFQEHLDRCLGCRGCETVCPSGVEYGILLERAREVAGRARPAPFAARALLGLIRRPALLRAWMLGSRLARWSRIPGGLVRILPSRGRGGTLRLAMAMLAASLPWRPPRPRRTRAVGAETVPDPRPERRGSVALLTGCVQDELFRRVNVATRRVLEANGWDVVEVSGQGCCGALHAHGGRLSEAREMARSNVRAFQAAGVDWIVANAAGCGATMREYGHLLDAAEPAVRESADWFSSRVRDISELLAGEGRVPRKGAEVRLDVAYDPPCHLLHGQRVEAAPVELLGSIPGVTLLPIENAAECCGGAGIYGLTHPELGGRIGSDKAAAVGKSGATLLVTGNPGCAMQIGAFLRMQGLRIQVAHPVELLDESYRRAGLYS